MGNRRQIEALLTNPRISGYTVTQLNDLSCEFHAGILDIWREPKQVFYETKRLQQPRVLILTVPRRSVTVGEPMRIPITLIDDVHFSDAEAVHVKVHDPNGSEVLFQRLEAPAGKGIKHLGTISLDASEMVGEWHIEAMLSGDECVTVEEKVLVVADVHDRGVFPVTNDHFVSASDPSLLSNEDWRTFISEVKQGKTGIVGNLTPGDELAREAFLSVGIDTQLQMGIGSWLGCYHWTVHSPLFEGLPSGGLAGEVYAEVIPHYVLPEHGGNVLAGTLTNTQTRVAAPAMLWYSDIEIVQLGAGRLIFCQYRIFDENLEDAVGLQLRRNLIKYARSLQLVEA
jgi:hypothetical protein